MENSESKYYECDLTTDGVGFKVIFDPQYPELSGTSAELGLMHSHAYYELFMSVSGDIQIYSANESLILSPGQITLISPNFIHSSRPAYSDIENGPKNVAQPFGVGIYINTKKGRSTDFSRRIDKIIAEKPPLGQPFGFENSNVLIGQISRHSCSGGIGVGIAANLAVGLLLSYLEHSNQPAAEKKHTDTPHNTKNYRENEIKRYLLEHYCEPVTLEIMSEQLYTSQQHINRILKKIYNQTFTQYITGLRMTKAVKELTGTDKSVTEIAYDTGYSSVHSFYSVFRRFYECTPIEYRKKHREK